MSELDLLTTMAKRPVRSVAIRDVSVDVLAEIARAEAERDANVTWVVAGIVGCVAAITTLFFAMQAWMSLDNPLAGLAQTVLTRLP